MLDSRFGLLSAELQRMTLLARAVVKNPGLLDEPYQGLDHAHRRLIVRAVEGLLRRT